MKLLMKRFLKFFKWTGITLGVLVALFIGIYAFDETLDPGAAAIINAQPKIKAEDNAYFFLVGLRAPADRDPGEFGRECVARLMKVSKNFEETKALHASGSVGCSREAKLDISKISCGSSQASCFSNYLKHSSAFKQLADENKNLLQRYDRLLSMTQFEELPFSIENASAHFFDLSIRELYSAVSVIKLLEGNNAEFVRRMVAAASYDRMVLRGDIDLIGKMIALDKVHSAARLVSDALRNYPTLATEYAAALSSISLPFTMDERSLESARRADLRVHVEIMRWAEAMTAAKEESFIIEGLYYPLIHKRIATINLQYRAVEDWRKLAQIPTERYLVEGQVALEQLTSPDYIRMIYNPMGNYLAGLGGANYAKFVPRTIDADGLLRLVSLQIQIAAQNIPESEIPAFLKNADPQLRDPYTGQPMQWDKTRGLYFRGHSDRITDKVGFVTLKL